MPAYGSTRGERATMAASLAFLFGSGALLVGLSLLLPHDEASTDERGVLLAVVLASLVAGALAAARGAVPIALLQAVLGLGTVLIGLCVLWGGRSGGAYHLLYVWVSLYAWFFLTTRAALVQMVIVAAVSAIVLVVQDDLTVPWVVWVMTVGTITVAGVLIGRLSAAVRAQASDLAAVSRLASGLTDLGATAQAACDGLLETTRADVAVFLRPGRDEDRLEVSASAGPGEATGILEGEAARAAIERAFRTGERTEVRCDEPDRLDRSLVGLADPVLRDGRPAAVLALAWTSPRRRIAPRFANALGLFSAQAAVALERAEEQRLDRERQALEINDNIVQGLVVAKYSMQRGNVDRALEALDETLSRARTLISAQLAAVSDARGGIKPGDLARAEASTVSQTRSPPS